ncbi:hypothetical protein SAY86_021921 [Trapa natans]|uniref:Uncharacterized protein n=1 Tax=Trapa natans TaxID=22666 RepID=A0AAN7MAK0_TRANT|nr:hypothetical protein SAY86_021921 [Trapa natans]
MEKAPREQCSPDNLVRLKGHRGDNLEGFLNVAHPRQEINVTRIVFQARDGRVDAGIRLPHVGKNLASLISKTSMGASAQSCKICAGVRPYTRLLHTVEQTQCLLRPPVCGQTHDHDIEGDGIFLGNLTEDFSGALQAATFGVHVYQCSRKNRVCLN